MSKKSVLVTGAGGFIGFHLVNYLKDRGYWVRGVDIKDPEYQASSADEFRLLDLREMDDCREAVHGMDEVYNLAADMGGIGYISGAHASITFNNTMISALMLKAAYDAKVQRFLFSSSACVYPQYLQDVPSVVPLKEDDAFPADPEPGYGLEKLYTEKLCEYFTQDYGFQTRLVRFHNVYGPLGTWDGGKEKAPAAICRKVAMAKSGEAIEVWGDGKQTRSFMYIDDCVEGIYRIMRSDYSGPLNLGTDELVDVSGLVDIIAGISGKTIHKRFNTNRPQGVRGRNSDNNRLREVLGWEPTIHLSQGLIPTYAWISGEVKARAEREAGIAHIPTIAAQ
ncbi:MAG: NAD-dependent epimerase/dehydratase family protein [Bosea sp.]|uniref:NAD-dependent epimerase/dehydratase family protein n=1 Tax=Bosea sp. (in: a-proteobacteria) TaxID=1871050 RepID=UPI0023855EFA|nr:NAD-dependent epimerase/dehydratase family protein [Bosea sp. (in: a-proteobacteria)]MCP4737990.1 NAD-dependent epimerase/dehydratase family protein [Bosea sp. (in: a-proteobacteria)]